MKKQKPFRADIHDPNDPSHNYKVGQNAARSIKDGLKGLRNHVVRSDGDEFSHIADEDEKEKYDDINKTTFSSGFAWPEDASEDASWPWSVAFAGAVLKYDDKNELGIVETDKAGGRDANKGVLWLYVVKD